MKHFKIIALIPARKGSKGIRHKNRQLISGKTLVEIAILKAKLCSKIDDIYVSTNDKYIARISHKLGAKIIFRPEKYSSDGSTAADVVRHFIDSLDISVNSKEKIVIVYLQPTTPFRTKEEICKCIRSYLRTKIPTVTIKESPVNLSKILKIDESGILVGINDKSAPTSNRQNLEKNYIANGEVYVFGISDFLRNGEIPVLNAQPILINKKFSLDIDSPAELELAQLIGNYYGI